MMRWMLAVVLGSIACGNEEELTGGASTEGGGGGASSGQGAQTNSSGSTSDTGGNSAGSLPPTDSAALFTWLADGSYLDWESESAIHPSAGPHGGDVRTFVNDTLLGSLADGASSHPAGSASVKELYSAGELRGWATFVKTSDDSAEGDNWFWYENFSVTNASSPVAADFGVGLCVDCHVAGRDYVLTPFPLQ
jgi:hypothetical protein